MKKTLCTTVLTFEGTGLEDEKTSFVFRVESNGLLDYSKGSFIDVPVDISEGPMKVSKGQYTAYRVEDRLVNSLCGARLFRDVYLKQDK
ncbi:hypothetical protein GOV12_03350 [Candidatus Pacearchaeota archaeon]|nr:hypothetical protein [Candidatus Pacearchaeota archaeon]